MMDLRLQTRQTKFLRKRMVRFLPSWCVLTVPFNMVLQVWASPAPVLPSYKDVDVTADGKVFAEATDGKLAVADWRAEGFCKI